MADKIDRRPLAAEFVGTAMLVCAVVGSGIMAERLAGGNVAVALLANTIATGAVLVTLILAFAPVSGAHFNPCVSLVARIHGDLGNRQAIVYALVQIGGGLIGVAAANLMFELPVVSVAAKERSGFGVWLGEFVATFGLVGVITSVSRRHNTIGTAVAVAGFITAGYWFTSSTSFANPAVTIARIFSDSFTGIRPVDVPPFLVSQLLGAVSSAYFFNWLVPKER